MGEVVLFPHHWSSEEAVNTMARYLFDEAEGLSDRHILTAGICVIAFTLNIWAGIQRRFQTPIQLMIDVVSTLETTDS